MGLFEGHAFIKFDMLFDMEPASELLNTDVMHVEVPASCDTANAVEDVFGMLRTWERLNGYIRIGQNAVNRLGDGSG
jgi:hypothetical protein